VTALDIAAIVIEGGGRVQMIDLDLRFELK
jgi:hypothetical protein